MRLHVEPQFESLIERLVPSEEKSTWRAASSEQIEQLERVSGGPLPPFYYWFLRTMGAESPHPEIGYDGQDLRIGTVLEAYDSDLVLSDPRFLLIGRIPSPIAPELIFYDRERACRNDAMVVVRHERGTSWRCESETLREQLGEGILRRHMISRCSQDCDGRLECEQGGVFDYLDPIMDRLGFTQPLVTGDFCGLYERHDAALASTSMVDDESRGLQFFRLGGPSASTLRNILGEIATNTPIEIHMRWWEPPLP